MAECHAEQRPARRCDSGRPITREAPPFHDFPPPAALRFAPRKNTIRPRRTDPRRADRPDHSGRCASPVFVTLPLGGCVRRVRTRPSGPVIPALLSLQAAGTLGKLLAALPRLPFSPGLARKYRESDANRRPPPRSRATTTGTTSANTPIPLLALPLHFPRPLLRLLAHSIELNTLANPDPSRHGMSRTQPTRLIRPIGPRRDPRDCDVLSPAFQESSPPSLSGNWWGSVRDLNSPRNSTNKSKAPAPHAALRLLTLRPPVL
jgi:hypothetical protein